MNFLLQIPTPHFSALFFFLYHVSFLNTVYVHSAHTTYTLYSLYKILSSLQQDMCNHSFVHYTIPIPQVPAKCWLSINISWIIQCINEFKLYYHSYYCYSYNKILVSLWLNFQWNRYFKCRNIKYISDFLWIIKFFK